MSEFNLDEFCIDDILAKYNKKNKKKDKAEKDAKSKDKKKKKDKPVVNKEDQALETMIKDTKKEHKKAQKKLLRETYDSGESIVIDIQV